MSTRVRDDRGAVLVEAALSFMLLATLLFGAVEFGLAWQAKNVAETAARAGARVGSSLGPARLADYSSLQSVKAAIADVGPSNVEFVIVFKASSAGGEVPAICLGAPPKSQPGVCNVYTGAQLQSLTQADFTGTTSCTGTSPDRFWCPTTRRNIQILGPDYIGVYVRARHSMLTNFFGQQLTLTTKTVMRLEPKVG